MDQSMSDKIDDLIKTVAGIVSDVKHVREKTDAIDNKVQVLNDKSIVGELTIASAHKRVDEIAPLVIKHEQLFIEAGGVVKAKDAARASIAAWAASALAILSAVASWFK